MGVNYLNSDNSTDQLEVLPLNSEQATSLIIERAKQLVNQLVECRGHNKPPFLPEEFRRLLSIKKIVKADLGNTSAVLLKIHDGYVIKVNEKHHVVKQNFSCAHEIGHILFSELKLEPYIQSIEYRTVNFYPQAQTKVRMKVRERLCDAAATELLMPEFVFSKYLSDFGVSVHSIERLANVFGASRLTSAIRIAEVSPEPCLALLWQPWPRSKPRGLRLAWSIGPGSNSRGKANYRPVHTLVKYPSTLHKAYQYDNPVKSWKLFKVDSDGKRLPMESKGFGRGETRYVLSLAFPER